MKNLFLLMILSVAFSCSSSKNKDWFQATENTLEHKVCKQDKYIKYFFDTDVSVEDREATIDKCEKYIEENLSLIGESSFCDSTYIIFVRDVKEMYELTRTYNSGICYPPEDIDDIKKYLVFCRYGGSKIPLKHELMHLVTLSKWGIPEGSYSLQWLSEGLATYADPQADLGNYTIEERYRVFLENGILSDIDTLLDNFNLNIRDNTINHTRDNYLKIHIHYNQSAYIVQYMIENYGIEKVKQLWQKGMRDFDIIFDFTIEEMIMNIEKEIKYKYPNPPNVPLTDIVHLIDRSVENLNKIKK